ncbi:MAG: hypothetical protein KGI10_03050 [Thaumarchaeota archaeon]|nr:hypothetical protein [Nitrososphaerota archaeon]
MTTRKSLFTLSVMMILSFGLLDQAAFASTNPYTAGYPTTSTITIHNQYTMKSDFSGTTGPRNQALAQVFSTAGFQSTSSTDPTGWIDQDGVQLATNNEVYGTPEIWYTNVCKFNCLNSQVTDIGHFGTGSTDISFVYHTFFWDSARNNIDFYYENHQNNGGIVSYPYNVAPRQTGDNSNDFATGTKTVSNTPIKFFQFGVESGDPLTSTWFAKEYDLTYQGINSYNTQTTATTDDNNNQQTGSWITYVNNNAYPVGLSTYTQANAHSKLIDNTFAAGTVQWYESGTHVPAGTQLWP